MDRQKMWTDKDFDLDWREPIPLLDCPFCGAAGTSELYKGGRVNCSAGLRGQCYLAEYSIPVGDWQFRKGVIMKQIEQDSKIKMMGKPTKETPIEQPEACKVCQRNPCPLHCTSLEQHQAWLLQ